MRRPDIRNAMNVTRILELTLNLPSTAGRFDDFMDIFNNERPHEALDMKYSAKVYHPSTRLYKECRISIIPFLVATIRYRCSFRAGPVDPLDLSRLLKFLGGFSEHLTCSCIIAKKDTLFVRPMIRFRRAQTQSSCALYFVKESHLSSILKGLTTIYLHLLN